MNNELNFPPNFEGLVLGYIDADFCKKILVGKLSPRSTQCIPLHRCQFSKFREFFHFSVSPHVPFLNLLFEQIANSNEYLVFTINFSIYLQHLASIQPSPVYQPASQPRTSRVKFARSPRTDRLGRPHIYSD